MSLYKDPKSDYWYIYLYDADGKRIRVSSGEKSKRKAQERHDEMAHHIRMTRLGLIPAPSGIALEEEDPPPQIPLSIFAEKYDEFMRAQFQPKTAEACRSAFASLKRYFNTSDPNLIDITVDQVTQWQVWVLSTSKPATLDIHYRTLRAAWNRAIRWGDALENPFAMAESPRLDRDEDDENVRFFEPEELEKLFRVTKKDPRWHTMVKFYLYSGMRRQELTHLEWSDIDLGKKEIHLSGRKTVRLPKITYTLKKRSYTLPAREYKFRTKNGKRRTIPINARFRELIDDLKAERKQIPALDKCPLVFPAIRTACQNRVIQKDVVTRRFRQCVAEAGLPDSLTLHSLRHTFASRLIQSGRSLYQVGNLLGHTDLEVTKIYAHLSPQSLHPVVEDLDFEL